MIEVRSRKPNRIMTSFLVIGHGSVEPESSAFFLAHTLEFIAYTLTYTARLVVQRLTEPRRPSDYGTWARSIAAISPTTPQPPQWEGYGAWLRSRRRGGPSRPRRPAVSRATRILSQPKHPGWGGAP